MNSRLDGGGWRLDIRVLDWAIRVGSISIPTLFLALYGASIAWKQSLPSPDPNS